MRTRNIKLVLAALLLAQAVLAAAQQRKQPPAQPQPQVRSAVQPQAHIRLYQRRDTWYEFLLKQFNPDSLDYGAWMEQRRHAFLEARVRNPYFGYSLFATLTLLLMSAAGVKMWMDHRRALWVTAEMMADVYNHDLHSREAAREAIQRYNDGASADDEALRAELQRVGGELATVKRENESIQEQLRTKNTLLAEMSLRLEGLARKSGTAGDNGQRIDLRGASPDLVKHINSLQEQLYAERQKNRQLKGA